MRLAARFIGCLPFVVFLLFWAASYTVFDRVSVPLERHRTLVLISYRGSVSAVVVPIITIPEIWWERGDVIVPGSTYPDQIWPRKRLFGFGWITRTLYLNVPNPPYPRDRQTSGLTGRSYGARGSGVIAPDWFIALMLFGVAAVAWRGARYSIRSLIIATTIVAVLMGILTMANRGALEKLPLQ